MKKYLIIISTLCFTILSKAQNVGIGTGTPVNKLHVIGSLLINEPTVAINSLPTPAQTTTLINNSTVAFLYNDSTGYIYDPGGPAGNYISNLIAFADVNAGSNIGFEINFTDMDLNTGDSLIIKESSTSTNPALYAVGNGFSSTGKIIINGSALYLIFKSNGDANIGRGFSMQFRRLYSNTAILLGVTGVAGNALYYDTKKSAFRAGKLNNSVIGDNSFGSGNNTTASGSASTATGYNTIASGTSSTATGYGTTASGTSSTAQGYGTIASGTSSTATGIYTTASGYASMATGSNNSASGDYSTATGFNTIASGYASTAMGLNTIANGNFSMALGNYVSTSNFEGSLTIGDNSTTTIMNTFVSNGFRARFANGYRLFTNSAANIGAYLNANANSWAALSDVRLKENFITVNGESFLKKIAAMPLSTWNYIGQDIKTLRHYGPMAQDFYKAFGHDALGEIGCDTLINQQDFLGVNLIAIQALEKRTQRIEKLELQVEALLNANIKLEQQVRRLKTSSNKRK